MAARKFSRLQATAVASLVLVAALTGCGGGGGSAPAAETPTATVQQVAVKVTSVTLTPSPSGDGMLVKVKAIGTNGADGSADLTARASWSVTVTGLGLNSANLAVTEAGMLQYSGKDLVVLPGQSSGVEAVASLNGSSASVKQTVTVQACGAGLMLSGSSCMVAGMTGNMLYYVGTDHADDGTTIVNRSFYAVGNDGTEHKLVLDKFGPVTQFCGMSVKLGVRGGRLISCNGLAGHEGETGTYEVGPNYLVKVDNVDRRGEADYVRARTQTYLNIGTPQECPVYAGFTGCISTKLYNPIAVLAANITN